MHNIPEYATLSPSVSNGAPRKFDFATGQFIAQISALGNFSRAFLLPGRLFAALAALAVAGRRASSTFPIFRHGRA
jgi:hypothetical protein